MVYTRTIRNSLDKELGFSQSSPSENVLRDNAHNGLKQDLQSVSVVLPAYNEEDSLPNLLRRLDALEMPENVRLDLIVVNDGSSDKTEELVRDFEGHLQITLLNHEQNMGLGQAVQTGIKEALALAEDNNAVVIMDADDTHDVQLILHMIKKIDAGAEIVIASRFVDGGDDSTAPPFRRLLSRGASFIFKVVFPLNEINDFTSGYRAYDTKLLKRADEHWGNALVMEQGFACMVELLLKLRHWQPKIVEIPFELRYDRKLSASKLKLFRTLGQYLKLAIRDRVSPAPTRL